MLAYNQIPQNSFIVENIKIDSFISHDEKNIDTKTVESFGKEWTKFRTFSENEIKIAGDQYFDIVNEAIAGKDSFVLDIGCGTGRWSRYLADKVKFIEAIDPSDAVFSAVKFNKDKKNFRVTNASVDNIPFDNDSFDFIMCLGVLHHIPDTESALQNAVKKLKPQGHILLYLYYDLENRGFLYRSLFFISGILRRIISSMPYRLKFLICEIIAFSIYLPLIASSYFVKIIFKNNWYKKIPLSYYLNKSISIIRNDALDRFGTPLEKRFSKSEILAMMKKANLCDICFSDNEPFWHVIGKKI